MDLSTRYMGMTLKNPILPAASPLSMDLDGIKRLEEAGASAVVMYSLFEEQISGESESLFHYLSYNRHQLVEALSYFPEASSYNLDPDGYLELIARAKESVGIPVIGSLNSVSSGGWVGHAHLMEQAGADGLVLQMQGSMSQLSVPEPAAFERANYMKTLQSFRAVR